MSSNADQTADILLDESSAASLEDILNAVDYPNVTQPKLALADVIDGLRQWRIWFMMAYQDIKLRYRRSILGPLWITLSMAITVYSMGFLYAHLFRTGLNQYYPFLVAGMLAWSLISTMIIEQTDAFMVSEQLIKQIKLPYTLYIHRISTRNIIAFFHNILVMVPIYFLFHDGVHINFNTLLLFPGLFVIYVNSITYGLLCSIIGTRFRDVSQVVKSLVQVVFFVTPVMWDPSILPKAKQFLVHLNPFYAFLELIRAPLLGRSPTSIDWGIVAFVTVLGFLLSARFFIPYRSRIIYWL